MTAQTLYETLTFLNELDSKINLQGTLESVRDSLTSITGSPGDPSFQNALASNMSTFKTTASKLAAMITPARTSAIGELGGAEYYDPRIAETVQQWVSANGMTPSVARDQVKDLASRRKAFLDNVRATASGLETLGIRGHTEEPGSADLAFLIPREIFENHLGPFAKELIFINRLLQHMSEGITGKTEPVFVETLSSSVPIVEVGAALVIIEKLATIVNKFLDAWDKVKKFRKARNELTELGLSEAAIEELDERITTIVEEVVEESTEVVMVNYGGLQERKHELENGLKQDMRRLFGQIERGLAINVRAEPNPNATSADEKAALETVANLGQTMVFPQVSPQPLLLQSGEVLEGEIASLKYTKKTTVQKSTTSKKDAHKETKQEPKRDG